MDGMAEHDQPLMIYLRERWNVVWLPLSHTADLKNLKIQLSISLSRNAYQPR